MRDNKGIPVLRVQAVLVLCLFVQAVMFTGCSRKQQFEGVITSEKPQMMYLFEVDGVTVGSRKLIDSIEVSAKGYFAYPTDSLTLKLYYLSYQKDGKGVGGNIFVDPSGMKVSITQDSVGNRLSITSDNSIVQSYADFQREIFHSSRSVPNVDSLKKFIKRVQEESKGTPLGLYLFSTDVRNGYFTNVAELDSMSNILLTSYAEYAGTPYYREVEEKLSLLANTVIGGTAPEIIGLDKEDKVVRLSDFRGQYLLLDFWSSSCKWCRAETPNLQRAYQKYKGDNFTVLGISTDHDKDAWLRAIEEDESYWDHVRLRPEEVLDVLQQYGIVGIPEIMLLDPDGLILAKGLRGEDIFDAVASALGDPAM
jgi:peroxiredoxin